MHFNSRIEKASDAAAYHAADVDAKARFPTEAIEELKAARLLGVLLPHDKGGEAAGIVDVAEMCFKLAGRCSSTAMIFAMHQIQVACLIRHSGDSEWHHSFMRQVSAEQLLLASSTTEGGNGGGPRQSKCAVKRGARGFSLFKASSVLSYGWAADGILVTARRGEAASEADQVLAVLQRDDYELEKLAEWDAMGMRGTCSESYQIAAHGIVDQILPDSFSTIHRFTMLPVSHLLWSAVWAGIAADAVERARMSVKAGVKSKTKQSQLSLARLYSASTRLRGIRSQIINAIERFSRAKADRIDSISFQTEMNQLKINVSTTALVIALDALQVGGLRSYAEHGRFSIARHVRDLCSGPLMINNDKLTEGLMDAILLLDASSGLNEPT